jgi:iron complex outermembrane receptor protein
MPVLFVPCRPTRLAAQGDTVAADGQPCSTLPTALLSAGAALNYLPSTHVRERYIGDRNGILVMRVNGSTLARKPLSMPTMCCCRIS